METKTLDALHHVAVNVADIDQSIRWYTSSFNCEVVLQTKTHAVLRFANLSVTLTLPSAEPAHLAFERDDAATLGALRPRIEGIHSTFLADPTGNVIEIVGAPKAEA